MEYRTSRVFHLTISLTNLCHSEISGQLCGNFTRIKLSVRLPKIKMIQRLWKILQFWEARKWSVPMIFLAWWLNFQVIHQDCLQNLRKLNNFRLRVSCFCSGIKNFSWNQHSVKIQVFSVTQVVLYKSNHFCKKIRQINLSAVTVLIFSHLATQSWNFIILLPFYCKNSVKVY